MSSRTWFTAVVPYRFRGLHRAYAYLRGYFWLPCILCGREYGGHEWNGDSVYTNMPNAAGCTVHYARGICPQCSRAGKGERATYERIMSCTCMRTD